MKLVSFLNEISPAKFHEAEKKIFCEVTTKAKNRFRYKKDIFFVQ